MTTDSENYMNTMSPVKPKFDPEEVYKGQPNPTKI